MDILGEDEAIVKKEIDKIDIDLLIDPDESIKKSAKDKLKSLGLTEDELKSLGIRV